MSPEAEQEILLFLRSQRDADIAGSLRKIADWSMAHEVKDAERHMEIVGALKGHSLRLGELERDRDKIEKDLDDTGRHQVLDLQERSKWSGRFIATTIVTAVVALVSGVVGVIATLLSKR